MLVADFFEVGDFDEAEFGMQGDAACLIGINATEDGVVADLFGEFEEFAEQQTAKTFALMLVMQVNRVLDTVAVGLARMETAERSPTDDDAMFFGHDYGMLRPVCFKPVTSLLFGARHGLIGAGAVLDVVVVDRVDGRKVGKRGRA